MFSEEDLVEQQDHFCNGDTCSPYCQNNIKQLPQIVISNAGCGGGGGDGQVGGASVVAGSGVGVGTGGGGIVIEGPTSNIYFKVNSSPMIRRQHKPVGNTKRLPLMATAGRGPSTDTTTTTTTTSDSMDLLSSTDNDLNASNDTNTITLQLSHEEEITKDSGQSSSVDEDEFTTNGRVLKESTSLTSLVIHDPNRPPPLSSPFCYETIDSTTYPAPFKITKIPLRRLSSRNNRVEARNSLSVDSSMGLPLSTQTLGQPSSESEQSHRKSIISDHRTGITVADGHSEKDDNPLNCDNVKQETARFNEGLGCSDSLTGRGGKVMTGQVKVLQGHQSQHNLKHLPHMADSDEVPDSVELSKSSDIALDTQRTCFKRSQEHIDESNNEAPLETTKKKPSFKETERNKQHRTRLTKRRHKAAKGNKIIVSQEKRAAKTLGIIMGCFVVCWLPFFIVAVMRPFYIFPPVVMEIITWLGYFNSLINPGIYTFFNQDFRRAFHKIITCKICKKENICL